MNIDFKMLQVQRNVLLSIHSTCNVNEEEKAALDGVVNLLEALLDQGIDEGECRIDEEGNVIQDVTDFADNDPGIILRT